MKNKFLFFVVLLVYSKVSLSSGVLSKLEPRALALFSQRTYGKGIRPFCSLFQNQLSRCEGGYLPSDDQWNAALVYVELRAMTHSSSEHFIGGHIGELINNDTLRKIIQITDTAYHRNISIDTGLFGVIFSAVNKKVSNLESLVERLDEVTEDRIRMRGRVALCERETKDVDLGALSVSLSKDDAAMGAFAYASYMKNLVSEEGVHLVCNPISTFLLNNLPEGHEKREYIKLVKDARDLGVPKKNEFWNIALLFAEDTNSQLKMALDKFKGVDSEVSS